MMDRISACKKTVATIATGKAMSCGSVLLSCGSEGMRFISPNATVMIHDVSSWAVGKVEEVKTSAEESERLNKLIFETMAKNCGHKSKYFLNLIHDKSHADWFLTAEETVKHNLANHIRVPSFEVKVSLDITYK